MKRFDIIAFNHHQLDLEEVGYFHLEQEDVARKMEFVKSEMNIAEIMYLTTCNRVEFIFVTDDEVDDEFKALFIKSINSKWDHKTIHHFVESTKHWNGINAVNHLIEVASSVDSVVVGEREIITQVRDAYEFSRANGLSGDVIRVVMRQVIETAKKVYTQTEIATKPVSIVSLAYHHLRAKNIANDARILIVGAGITNTNMCRFLKKHGFKNFVVYNRSLENAEKLAGFIDGEAKPLGELKDHKSGFDVLLTCTASKDPVISPKTYESLLAGEGDKKIVIDLAVPGDIDPEIIAKRQVEYVSIDFLKTISNKHLEERKKELIKVHKIIYQAVEDFKEIFKMRQVEIKMRGIPERVKEIRATAINDIFSKDLESMDENSREVLDKILNYMEKKYVSVPMLMAKELIQKDKSA